MAKNNDTIGEFKIKVEVEGQQAVKTDLDKIRNNLKQLKDELSKVTKEGKKLADVLKSLKSPNINVSGGGGGKSGAGVFAQIGKDAKEATKHISKFAEAIRAAKGDAGSLARGFSKAETMLDHRIIGEIQRDASGNIIGRTGLHGVSYSISQINRQMRGGLTNAGALNRSFRDIVGESKRDPTTGQWKRTGSKATIHSLDALSKAAKGAAKNLDKIAKIKGLGGGVGGHGGAGGVPTTWMERQLKMMKGSEKTLTGLGDIVRRANVGNLGALNQIANSLGTFGRLAGMFMSGPIGIGAGLVGAGSAYLAKHFEWEANGKHNIDNLYRYKKRADIGFLNTNAINANAQGMLGAYVVRNEDGTVNAKATDEAAHYGEMRKRESFEDSVALFHTRGKIAPWMEALAMQGIDFTSIGSHEGLRQELAKKYQGIDKNDKYAVYQWKTLLNELGPTLDESDRYAITFKGGTFKNKEGKDVTYGAGYDEFKRASKEVGTETLYQSGMVGENGIAEDVRFKSITQGNAQQLYNARIGKEQVDVAVAISEFSKTMDGVKSEWENFTTHAKSCFAQMDKDILKIYNPKLFNLLEHMKLQENRPEAQIQKGAPFAVAPFTTDNVKTIVDVLKVGYQAAKDRVLGEYNYYKNQKSPISQIEQIDDATTHIDGQRISNLKNLKKENIDVNVNINTDADGTQKITSPLFVDFLSDAIKSYMQESIVH